MYAESIIFGLISLFFVFAIQKYHANNECQFDVYVLDRINKSTESFNICK